MQTGNRFAMFLASRLLFFAFQFQTGFEAGKAWAARSAAKILAGFARFLLIAVGEGTNAFGVLLEMKQKKFP